MIGSYKPVEVMGEPYRLGEVIHGERVKQGYKSASEFCDAVLRVTGIEIKFDTMQRIEAGRQEPKVIQYVAIAITLDKLEDSMLWDSIPDAMLRTIRAGGRTVKESRLPDGWTRRVLANGRSIDVSPDGSEKLYRSGRRTIEF